VFTVGDNAHKISGVILVTGASGFVGRSLTEVFRREELPFKVYSGRMSDSLALRAHLADVEKVIHLASAESRNRISLLRSVDVQGTERLLRESRIAGVGRLLVVSRLNADPNSHFALLRTKGVVERLVRQGEVPYTIIRSATLFGRDDRFLNVIAGLAAWTWPFVWVPGRGRVAQQPLWIEDLVRCIMATLDRPDLIGKTVEVAGSERIRYQEIVHQVLHTAGMKRITITPRVKLVRLVSALLLGWWRRPPVTRFAMDRFSVPEVAPLDSVLRQFGFQPSRLNQRIGYLRRSHPGLALWRKP
jgi:NADH dehydrogenase